MKTEFEIAKEKRERNDRVVRRYDELMAEGKHGHYETMFRIVNEEVGRAEQIARSECLVEAERKKRITG